MHDRHLQAAAVGARRRAHVVALMWSRRGRDGAPARKLPDGLLALAGGLAGAGLLVLLHVPAGGIVGAVAGSALASGIRAHPPPRFSVRVVGMVLLGCAAGVRLEAETLQTLWHLLVPLLLAVGTLLAMDVALATVLVRRYAVDPVTALLACAPGGVAEAARRLGAAPPDEGRAPGQDRRRQPRPEVGRLPAP